MRRAALVAFALAAGCAHRPAPPPPPPLAKASSAAEALARALAVKPERFKMVHQVAAHVGPQSYVMSGYMLGRRDGAFRVSASAAVGPKLFDVSRVDGQWQTQVHLKQIADRMDPLQLAKTIERIYFAGCAGEGAGAPPTFVFRCPLEADPDFDTLEVTFDARYLGPTKKKFFKAGQPSIEVDYQGYERFGEEWQAKKIHVAHAAGSLDVALIDYVPGFAFDDAKLVLSR